MIPNAWDGTTLVGSTSCTATTTTSSGYSTASAGYSWRLTKDPDRDGDGLPDNLDQCPDQPATTANGCLDDSNDNDGDGVPNSTDACPDTPAGTSVNVHGRPLDSDGDGVPDTNDRCPDTFPGVPVDENGCDKLPDADGDGVPDLIDQCKDTPAGTPVNAVGCPKSQDADGDNVLDVNDNCPATKAGLSVNSLGCSDEDGDGYLDDGSDVCPTDPHPNTPDGCNRPPMAVDDYATATVGGNGLASFDINILTNDTDDIRVVGITHLDRPNGWTIVSNGLGALHITSPQGLKGFRL